MKAKKYADNQLLTM